MARGRFGRRAALRAAMGAGIAGAATRVPQLRKLAGAAIGAAVVAGAAQESPLLGAASAVALVGVTKTGLRADGLALGAGAALATRRLWPVAPRAAAAIRPALTPLRGEPTEDGDGLTIIVNPSAGPLHKASPTETLTEAFPKAVVLEIGDDLTLDAALERAAHTAKAIGIAGGDGSVGAAAAVARRAGKPLAVVPAGTLNHLARDLGINALEDAIGAIKDGELAAVDVASIDGKPFLNTASFGVYSALVDARERLEDRIGKWPALVVALVHVLRKGQPMLIEVDGVRRRIWMIFIGNCRYHPAGFAPSWRERLDDRKLDIRLVHADRPFARLRLFLAVLTGRLGRSTVYEATTAESMHIDVLDGPVRLARDGETFDGSRSFDICKEPDPLPIYVLRSDRPT